MNFCLNHLHDLQIGLIDFSVKNNFIAECQSIKYYCFHIIA
jgi:hypothetical protein